MGAWKREMDRREDALQPDLILAGEVKSNMVDGGRVATIIADAKTIWDHPLMKPIAIDAMRLKSMIVSSEILSRLPGKPVGLIEAGAIIADMNKVSEALRELKAPPAKDVELPPKLPALTPLVPARPVTLEDLISNARSMGLTEIYATFRHRDSRRIADDRLEDCMLVAPTLQIAVGHLIRLAGYGRREAKDLGLHDYDVGTISELCAHLETLTGDRFSFSSYEIPPEIEDDEE